MYHIRFRCATLRCKKCKNNNGKALFAHMHDWSTQFLTFRDLTYCQCHSIKCLPTTFTVIRSTCEIKHPEHVFSNSLYIFLNFSLWEDVYTKEWTLHAGVLTHSYYQSSICREESKQLHCLDPWRSMALIHISMVAQRLLNLQLTCSSNISMRAKAIILLAIWTISPYTLNSRVDLVIEF